MLSYTLDSFPLKKRKKKKKNIYRVFLIQINYWLTLKTFATKKLDIILKLGWNPKYKNKFEKDFGLGGK